MLLQLTEVSGEVTLLLVGQWLVAEYQHGVPVHAGLDCRDLGADSERLYVDPHASATNLFVRAVSFHRGFLRSFGSCCLGLRRGHRIAAHGGASHVADVVQIVVAARPMHRGAVVPDHQVPLPPGMGMDELGCVACSVRSRMKARASGIGQPTMPPIWADRYRDFRPVTGWKRTRLWRTGRSLFWFSCHRPCRKADRFARISIGVFGDQILDFGLRCGYPAHRKRRAYRRTLCCRRSPGMIRADSNEYFAGMARNEASECHSRLPSAIRRTRSSAARSLLSRSRLEMSAISSFRRRSSGLLISPPEEIFQFSEVSAEGQLGVVVEALVVEYQDGEAIHAGVDRGHLAGGQRPGQVDSGHLAREIPGGLRVRGVMCMTSTSCMLSEIRPAGQFAEL